MRGENLNNQTAKKKSSNPMEWYQDEKKSGAARNNDTDYLFCRILTSKPQSSTEEELILCEKNYS
jgi:hypothetical protein